MSQTEEIPDAQGVFEFGCSLCLSSDMVEIRAFGMSERAHSRRARPGVTGKGHGF